MILTTTSRVSLTIVVVAVLVFRPVHPPAEAQSQANRDLRVRAEVKELPAKAKRFALIIGVDEYRDKQINRLYGAARDAQTLRDALVKYAGFPEDQVTLLATGEPEEREPSRANILQRLLNLNGLVPQDGLLLVSFAGHGVQRSQRGFLLPADAKIGSLSQLENTAISVADMKNFIRQTGVKQVLVIMDACRNDPGGRADGANPMSSAYRFDFDTRNQEVEAFATLYATDVGNRAYEYTEKSQGYFTWFLIEGLKGEAANARGEVTLAGLVRYLQDKVPKRVLLDLGQERKQRPWADIEGYKADELVISITLRVPPVTAPVSALDPAAIELELWNSIKNSGDPEGFKAYLEKFPNGTFSVVARSRIRQLEAAGKPNLPPTGPPAPNAVNMNAANTKASPTVEPSGLPLRSSETEAVLDTSAGQIVIEFFPKEAQGHVDYFIKQARSGAYDGTTFHRLVKYALIQGGDPLSKNPRDRARYGTGGLSVGLPDEVNKNKHVAGAVSSVLQAASAGSTDVKPGSSGAQFFIVLNASSAQANLDRTFTVFGRVVEGMDVVTQISTLPASAAGIASERIEIKKVTIREKTPTAEQMKSMHATIETSLGSIKLQLLPESAPNTARAFVRYARSGLYDGTTFFRVSQNYFMEVGYLGDWPQDSPNRKRIFSTWPIPAEKNEVKQERGTVSMRQNADGTTSWYFFIISKDNPALDGKHVPFAKVVDGLDVVDKIAQAEVDGDKPKQRIELKKITVQ